MCERVLAARGGLVLTRLLVLTDCAASVSAPIGKRSLVARLSSAFLASSALARTPKSLLVPRHLRFRTLVQYTSPRAAVQKLSRQYWVSVVIPTLRARWRGVGNIVAP